MEKDKIFRYNDQSERYHSMNKIYILATTILWLQFIIYLLLKLNSNSIVSITAYSNLALIALFAIGNVIIFVRQKGGSLLKRVVIFDVGIEFLLLGMQTNAEFLYYALIAILALLIPYYDRKQFKNACASYTILYTIVVAIRIFKGIFHADVDAFCRVICVYLLLFIVYRIGTLTKLFSDDALGSVTAQSEKQQAMFDGIVDISKIIHSETAKSSSLVDELVNVTQTVAGNMKNIATASHTTSQNIEEQNNMTRSIQTAIETTGEHSRQMVSVATESNASIQENIKVMESLKAQSAQIASTNHEVTASMAKLQEKTAEVENIAGMILNISSQTNLLALNASIESARAGEAGRGFAVVADQIRQLAEQTKQSTEEITRITTELSMNANDVVKSIESSIDATNDQNDKIISAAASFEQLNANMAKLIQDIGAIDHQISGLSESNNRIVDNISQLSAATQEVTASAEQVEQMSDDNLNYANEVKDTINQIVDTSNGLKKYL